MTVSTCSSSSVDLPISGVWDIVVSVRDADRCLIDSEPVVTVTLPDDTTATPTVERLALGTYRAGYVVGTAGRYVARAVAAGYGAADFTAFVTATVTGVAMPAIADLDEYLGTHSFTDDQLTDALDAEAAAQRKACKVPAAYSEDLRQALLRRCARNLAFRRVPLSVLQGDADAGTTNAYPGRDPEVRRLEAPYRKLPVG